MDDRAIRMECVKQAVKMCTGDGRNIDPGYIIRRARDLECYVRGQNASTETPSPLPRTTARPAKLTT